MAKRSKPKGKGRFKVQNDMLNRIERERRLQALEEAEAQLITPVREDIRNGLTSEQILEKYSSYAAAALVTAAATRADSSGITAAKEVLDRVHGKAIQKTEATHKFEKLKDDEIDALLASRLKELEDEDSTDVQ